MVRLPERRFEMGKKDIAVIAKFTSQGKVTPLSIIWDDGRRFDIDSVEDARRSASLKGGGIDMRYTCMIRGRQIYLFKDEDQWFLEVDDL